MFLHVINAKYLKDYELEVSFNNGQKGIADLSCILNRKCFNSLKDKKIFSTFFIDKELDTITWSNGTDLAPEYIYFQVFKNDPKLQQLFKQWGYVPVL